ncbi:S9 family peptidase [Brachybacterium sp. DNPG3]
MEPTDIELLTALSRPSLAPDGSFAVHASSRPDLRADRAVGQIWRTDLPAAGPAGSAGPEASDDRPAPRRLTRGVHDTAPQVSPDGETIAFLRPDDRDRPQLHLLDARGGEPLRLTDEPLGVSAFRWAPDASQLVMLARVPEAGRYGSVEGLAAAAESPRRITTVRWQANGLGYATDRTTQVFVLDVPSLEDEPAYASAPQPDGTPASPALLPTEPLQLTEEGAEHSSAVFTADGWAVLAIREEFETDRRDLRNQLVSIPLDGEEETILLDAEDGFAISSLAVAPDGAILLLASTPAEGRNFVAPDTALWILEPTDAEDAPIPGFTAPRRLTDPAVHEVGGTGIGPVALDEDVLVGLLSRGRTHLLRVDRAGTTATILDGDVQVTGIDAVRTSDGDRILAALTAPASPGRLDLLDLPLPAADAPPAGSAAGEPVGSAADGRAAARTLVDMGAALDGVELAAPTELELTGRSGYPVHGWVAAPEGEGPFPTILLIHGGPHAAYGVSLFDEVQTLVAAGFAVVYGNPRGSAGYGREHGRAVRRGFGTVDADDVLDLLEGALADDGRLDAERLGIMGGSYGGYLTAWTIAHDHRFRGAIVERGFLDPLSFQGTSDIGSYFGDEYIGTSAEDIARQSAFAIADQVRTPTLVIHAEQDLRCPLEQGTRYYAALRRAGVDAEMLIFPGEDHELTRSGRPRHRIERFEAVLGWWERILAD